MLLKNKNSIMWIILCLVLAMALHPAKWVVFTLALFLSAATIIYMYKLYGKPSLKEIFKELWDEWHADQKQEKKTAKKK